MKHKNLFYQTVTQDVTGIKAQRGGIMSRNAQRAQIAIIQEIQSRLDREDESELNLTDLSPDNTYDLRPGGKDFTSANWTKELQNISVRKMEIEVEMVAAKANYKKWFGEDYIDVITMEDDNKESDA